MCPTLSPPRQSGTRANAARPAGAFPARAALGLIAGLLLVQLVSVAIGWSAMAAPATSDVDLRLRLNPNTATAAELELLPRIGPKLAENIVQYRSSVPDPPAFRRAEDLDCVARIGPVTVELLRPFLYFAETSTVVDSTMARTGGSAPAETEAFAPDETPSDEDSR